MVDQEQFLGESPEFMAVLRAAGLVAPTDATVLVSGESGTGKELLSKYIHRHSRRSGEPWITINCAALPETLAESELFGHAKGAFTGATIHKKGWVQAADGGTLFLDEISELPISIQAKLLRLLESGDCQGVGHSRISKVDVRIIAATNKYLPDLVKKGLFREDLYYRLNIVPLELPPLRERLLDLPLLTKTFLETVANKNSSPLTSISKSTMAVLNSYSWPGNIRELRNFCERVAILHAGGEVKVENIPWEMRQESNADANQTMGGLFTLPNEGLDFLQMERDLIGQALQRTNGNKSRAARLLGFSRDTFLYRIKKFSILS
ncbi:MAG: sigma-54-dependent Fis family transcriptional regulator [Magnetococcales bacterium]|nr:sigma-54-dependent Fis family transcriptional regulator [Magnetococcales bacterium]